MENHRQDIPEAFIILDTNHQIIGVDPAGESLLNRTQTDLIGKSVAVIFPHPSATISFEEALKEGKSEARFCRADGQTFLAELTVSPIRGAGNVLFGHALRIRNGEKSIEAERWSQPERELKKRNEMLQALQETTIDLHSSLDLDVVLNNIVTRACALLGTRNGYLDIVRETGELEPKVGVGFLEESLKYKVIKGEGVAGVVWETGKAFVIDDYDQWQGRLPDFRQGIIRAVMGMPMMLNDQVVGVIGIARDADDPAVFSEEDVENLERFADLAVVALQNAHLFAKAQQEIEFRRKTEIQLRNANQVLKLQIERIELLQMKLQELAVRDPLTELYNRRYLTEALELELAHPERSRHTMAVLMMDSDHLKDINDQFGHKAGDDFLVQIADAIKDNIRIGDIACRYGGDEFVIVMSNLTPEAAYERAEDLRQMIARQYVVHRNEKISVSVSIGIAIYPAHGRSGDELLQKADLALYQAKRKGKNCVVVFGLE